METKNRLRPLVLSVTILIGVSGCALLETKSSELQTLHNAEYAMCFSAQSREITNNRDSGTVVIASVDGTFGHIDTAGMDHCELAWTEQGLHFSDRFADYRLSESGLIKHDSPKTDSQYALVPLSEESVVGLFNLGYSTEGGYTSQVVETDTNGSVLREVEGGYDTVSQCNGSLYGIGSATGPYFEPGDSGTEPILLNQLTGTGDGKERNIGQTRSLSYVPIAPNTPCVGGKIHFLADSGTGAFGVPAIPVLAKWDITTGEYEQIPLSADDSLMPFLSDRDFHYKALSEFSEEDSSMEWYGADNRVLSTNLQTGHTRLLLVVEGHSNRRSWSKAVFTETEVVVLVANNDDTSYRVVRYDRTTGDEIGRTVFDGLPKAVDGDYNFSSFAIKP